MTFDMTRFYHEITLDSHNGICGTTFCHFFVTFFLEFISQSQQKVEENTLNSLRRRF